MIQITKLSKEKAFVSGDLIEMVESTPDTVLFLQGGKRLTVRESVEEVIEKILRYKQLIHTSVVVRKKEGT